MKRHELELKWIKKYIFSIRYGNISKMPDFDIFLFWNVKNVKLNLMVNETAETLSAKFVLKNA